MVFITERSYNHALIYVIAIKNKNNIKKGAGCQSLADFGLEYFDLFLDFPLDFGRSRSWVGLDVGCDVDNTFLFGLIDVIFLMNEAPNRFCNLKGGNNLL